MGPLIIIFGVLAGITAIVSNAWLKSQKMKLENGGGMDSKKMNRLLVEFENVHEENIEMKERLKNLETIISGMDKEILQLHGHSKQADYAKEMAELVKKMDLNQ
jgi:hypothetical protein